MGVDIVKSLREKYSRFGHSDADYFRGLAPDKGGDSKTGALHRAFWMEVFAAAQHPSLTKYILALSVLWTFGIWRIKFSLGAEELVLASWWQEVITAGPSQLARPSPIFISSFSYVAETITAALNDHAPMVGDCDIWSDTLTNYELPPAVFWHAALS